MNTASYLKHLSILILFTTLSCNMGEDPVYPNWTVYDTSNSPLPEGSVWRVTADGTGKVWVVARSTDSELYLNDNGVWSNISLPHEEGQHILDIQSDELNKLWVCYDRDTVMVFDGQNWNLFVYPSGNMAIRDFQLAGNGSFWLATGDGLVHGGATGWETYTPSNSGLPTNELQCVSVEMDGGVWTGSFRDPLSTVGSDGLTYYDGSAWHVYDTTNSQLPDSRIMGIEVGLDGTKWILPRNGGIVKINENNWMVFNNQPQFILNDISIQNMYVSPDNQLWLCTNDIGLVKFSDNGSIIFETANSGIPSNRVNDITIDGNNNRWVATQKGLATFTDS